MGARHSLQSEVQQQRPRSSSTSEASVDRSRRFARQARNSENVSTDSDTEMDVEEMLAAHNGSHHTASNLRLSFRSPTTSHTNNTTSNQQNGPTRLTFLQALAAGLNPSPMSSSSSTHQQHSPAHSQQFQLNNSGRDRRSAPMLRFLMSGRDIKCPICHKRVPSDDAEIHLVMCFTRPQIAYNDDVLTEEKGECTICLEEMEVGNTIARLPCLCIYHKHCIDKWFGHKNCCPVHQGDD